MDFTVRQVGSILGKWSFLEQNLRKFNYQSSVRDPILFYFNFNFSYHNQS